MIHTAHNVQQSGTHLSAFFSFDIDSLNAYNIGHLKLISTKYTK